METYLHGSQIKLKHQSIFSKTHKTIQNVLGLSTKGAFSYRSRTMNQELKLELAKAFIDYVWLKGKISDEERSKSEAIIKEKLNPKKV